ncbi:ZnMc domain-containing protein [Aphelenchoides bicaudatus]|nr:ZnMc domain-containing protein [Aphelenchoides bicaudatus]
MFPSLIFVTLLFLATTALPVRDRRYALYKYKWKKCTLTFRFHDPYGLFNNEADYQTARQTIIDAIRIWERASNQRLKFIDASAVKMRDQVDLKTRPNIDISFAKGAHGCEESLDGPGGIVAHSAYLPHGLVHFDAQENWNVDGLDNSGPDLRYVALHELGHVLGIKHSNNNDSVMSPFYRDRRQRDFGLSFDDIGAIQQLYSHCK